MSHSSNPACGPAVPFVGWKLHVASTTTSTNVLAAHLPAWHAVRANVQTGGYGRTGRVWVSNFGGLWLSAVLPCPGPREGWALLPLAAGHAVNEALTARGVSGLRLRWPNDLLVGRRKLAGLLVERHTADTAVVGIGINVFNLPAQADPALSDTTVRLADLVELGNDTLDDVAACILSSLANVHAGLLADGFEPVVAALNRSWPEPRPVELTLAGRTDPARGEFLGIDASGALRLRTPTGGIESYDATQVALLREV